MWWFKWGVYKIFYLSRFLKIKVVIMLLIKSYLLIIPVAFSKWWGEFSKDRGNFFKTPITLLLTTLFLGVGGSFSRSTSAFDLTFFTTTLFYFRSTTLFKINLHFSSISLEHFLIFSHHPHSHPHPLHTHSPLLLTLPPTY